MKKGKIKLIILVVAITLLGGLLRFKGITKNPPSLTGDEISFGYSAYSVLKTGKDEHGKFMPLTFESVGDYKNPLPAYLMIPSIKVFGLTDFAVRFPNALLATLSIPIFFLFLLDVLKKKKVAILGSFFLAISTWHIFYSRFAYEATTASLFVLLGTWFLIKMLRGKNIWAIPSALFFSLTMYTSFAPRLFVPLFVGAILLFNLGKIKKDLKTIGIFVISCVVFVLPLAYTTVFQGAGTRLQMVFISNDIEFSRYVILKYFNSIGDLPMLFFFWAKRYLSYFDPRFLFLNGLESTLPNSVGLGIYYIFEIPFFIAGVISFIKNKIPEKGIFTLWALVGILPDSFTNNQKHTGRLIHMFPILLLFTTLGAIEIYKFVVKIKNKYLKFLIYAGFSGFVVITLTHAFLIYKSDFPRDKSESFDEGLREVSYYIRDHQSEYKEIVIDPRRGVAAPDMISNPFLYILFYTKYDPATYQNEVKITSDPLVDSYYKFDKYAFKNINWQTDMTAKDTLFVGSPWSFPRDMYSVNLIDTIYLSSGDPAFYIVTSTYEGK